MPAVVLCVLLCFVTALTGVAEGQDQESLRQVKEAIHRGCVACYATEGIYPPDLDYLKDRYGIQVDEERYMVDYSIFAPNMMPDITVLEK